MRWQRRVGTVGGSRCGRELASASPGLPNSRKRRAHLPAVWRDTPAARAALPTGQPDSILSTKINLPCTVNRALGCDTRTPSFSCGSTPTTDRTGPSLGQQPLWELQLGAEGIVVVSPAWSTDKTVYTLADSSLFAYTLGPQRKATLSTPTARTSKWDKRWVGWAVRFEGTIAPAQPRGWATCKVQVQRYSGGKWRTYGRVYPFKIDRKGKSKPIKSPSMVYSEILARGNTGLAFEDFVLRQTGRYRVRLSHGDASTTLGGDLASTSGWRSFTIH